MRRDEVAVLIVVPDQEVMIDQGSEASGTDSCPLIAINNPVSRVWPISGKSYS